LNPPFFLCVFLSPFVRSCGSLKGSRIGFAKFFRRNTTPFSGRGDFPETLQGLKLCHSNLRFTFAAGTIKHQATGRQNAVVQETDYVPWATPLFVFSSANYTNGLDWGMCS
jgi:hypothetical protein